MKKQEVSFAKKKVECLVGKQLKIRYNKGRNKIVYFDGIISEFYKNVFVITVFDQIFDRVSCSYTDLLCGDVAFKIKNSSYMYIGNLFRWCYGMYYGSVGIRAFGKSFWN